MQNVDLAAEVLRAAAVDLHGASFQLHVASEAVIVIGSRQHTSTGLDKGAIGISSAQLAANSHIMPVGIDDGGFARDTGHIDIFGEGEVGICDQSTVMDADGAVSSQGRLCFDGQSAAGDSGNAAVGIGTGLGQQGYGAAAVFDNCAVADDLPNISIVVILLKNQGATVGQVDVADIACNRVVDRQAFGFGRQRGIFLHSDLAVKAVVIAA